jgi:hypothetical protein
MASPPEGSARRILRDKRLYIAIVLVGAWAIGSFIARPFYDRAANDDDADQVVDLPGARNYVELARLVQDSTRIVIATLESETAATGTVPTIRNYTIVESLKGGGAAGAPLEVWGDTGPGVEGMLALEPGKDYVLFLVERQIDGTSRWSAPGEPSAAEPGDAGTLAFVVSDRYAADMLRFGWTTGTQRVPFRATLDDVRRLVATPPAP